MLTREERAILEAVDQGRAVRANEHGPALTRTEFGAACGMALRDMPLTRALRRSEGGPALILTDAGRAALSRATGQE